MKKSARIFVYCLVVVACLFFIGIAAGVGTMLVPQVVESIKDSGDYTKTAGYKARQEQREDMERFRARIKKLGEKAVVGLDTERRGDDKLREDEARARYESALRLQAKERGQQRR